MDRSIRDKSRRRRLLLACVTALGAFVVVYFANAAYHELLLDKLGLSPPRDLGDPEQHQHQQRQGDGELDHGQASLPAGIHSLLAHGAS